MSETKEADLARAVIQEYVDACAAGSAERLRTIFHDNALMSGYMMGEYLMGSPEPFFQAVENPPPGADTGGAYQAEITSVEVSGPVASITLKEAGFMGVNFTDYFHLAKVNDEWKIISKTFNPEMP
ncbi:MAG: nuclear transport factor 2 family protein [Gammaproteobacteria bacterium]|nr:nuclear transport factor 2 family protein [Gammaproteobacteria bacterium]